MLSAWIWRIWSVLGCDREVAVSVSTFGYKFPMACSTGGWQRHWQPSVAVERLQLHDVCCVVHCTTFTCLFALGLHLCAWVFLVREANSHKFLQQWAAQRWYRAALCMGQAPMADPKAPSAECDTQDSTELKSAEINSAQIASCYRPRDWLRIVLSMVSCSVWSDSARMRLPLLLFFQIVNFNGQIFRL